MDRSILKKKLRKGPAFGTFINLPAACMPEIIALAGYDFAIIDLEHAGINDDVAEAMLRSADIHGLPIVVRPRELNRAYVLRAFDQGASAIQVPQLDTVAEAELAVKYGKYPPHGVRGVCATRASAFGLTFSDYLKNANDDLTTIVHCETKAFLDIIEDAVKVPGLDCIFLGPYDLSVSLGYPGDIDHPVVKDAIKHFAAVCNEFGMITGIYVRDAADAKMRIEQGFRYIAYSVDVFLMLEKYTAFMKDMKKGMV